ncbi:MAG: hypothetical protein HY432_03435 [Candidatus Liptonbacteria bacterium]|nr:hypothetical protein [Candidatus Liptonbacteria bacterium]
MEKENISNYEKKLKEQKTRLEADIKKYSEAEDFGNDADHLEEEADESESYANRMAIASDLKKDLNEVDMALNRIKMGTYGICTKCGGEISEDILDIAPESELCTDCKKKEK